MVSCVLITDILLDVGGALDVVDELSMSGPDYNLVAWLFVCFFPSLFVSFASCIATLCGYIS